MVRNDDKVRNQCCIASEPAQRASLNPRAFLQNLGQVIDLAPHCVLASHAHTQLRHAFEAAENAVCKEELGELRDSLGTVDRVMKNLTPSA